jgi:hypothetical protein
MQIVTVTVGPLVAADADGWALTQIGGAGAVTLNGTKATGFDADNIAVAQAVGSATNLTLNGALVVSGVALLNPAAPRSVSITSAGNDSGISFTVYGATGYANGVYVYGQETISGANTGVRSTATRFYTVTRVAASAAAAGNVSVGTNGYVIVDEPRRGLITSAGDDTGDTFVFYGTDWSGNAISESIAGSSASTAQTLSDFATVDLITMSGATASTGITVGTSGVASSRPIFLDRFGFAPTALQVDVTGTVNFTVQQTLDNPNGPVGGPGVTPYDDVTWFNHPDSALASATADAQGNYAYIPNMTRITLNSGTGSVTYKVLQAGPI